MLPQLFTGTIVLFIFWLIAKYIGRLINLALKDRLEDPLVVRFIVKLAKIILFIVAILAFLNIMNMGGIAAGIWGTAGVGAFILGFAFKDIGEHFLAGFILAFNRPFRTGDTVEIGNHIGTVVGLNLRNTHIKTFDGADVYIPNGNVIKNPLINYTIDGFIRKNFLLEVLEDQNLSLAVETLVNVMFQHPEILKEGKTPNVVLSKDKPGMVTLKCLYWLNTFDKSISSVTIERQLIAESIKALKDVNIDMAPIQPFG